MLKTFVTRHAAAAYFALTFTISWAGVLLVIVSGPMSGSEGTSDPRFVYALIAMLAGPSTSGLLLTAVVNGRVGLRELLSRLLNWRAAATWYAVALLAAPLMWVATLLALSLASPRFLPALLTVDDKTALVLAGLAVALAAGVFEELGWTGFAIPQIRRRHGVFATGLLVGMYWGAWHLIVNVFWAGPATSGDLPLLTFMPLSALGLLVGYLTAFRVLMVWVYEHTRSVFVAMLMHLSLTASVLILDPQGLTGAAMLIYFFALAVTVWIAAVVITARNRPRVAQGVKAPGRLRPTAVLPANR